MRVSRKYPAWVSMLFAGTLMAIILFATPASAAEDKPFAEHKVVLQISDNDPTKQTLVLNVANNMLKHYGSDKVDVEIVAFGPGVRLMFDDNVNKGRISGLNSNGVRFYACGNTLKKMTKALGREPVLNPHAKHGGGGIVRILELTDQGYTLVKP
jgi:intracellular sulfur oxidation DsrE/DsrF family protein